MDKQAKLLKCKLKMKHAGTLATLLVLFDAFSCSTLAFFFEFSRAKDNVDVCATDKADLAT